MSARPPPRTSTPAPQPPVERPSPGAATTGPSITVSSKVTRNALVALAAFDGITALALVAWFASAESPWGLASFITLLSLVGGIVTAVLLWRRPLRDHAFAALGVMGFSILRVGPPSQWTWASVALVTLTAVLAIPVVLAATVLPRS